MGTKVTLQDVLEVTNRIDEKLDKISDRVSVLEIWRANLTGRLAVIGSAVIIVVNIFWSAIKDRLFKNL